MTRRYTFLGVRRSGWSWAFHIVATLAAVLLSLTYDYGWVLLALWVVAVAVEHWMLADLAARIAWVETCPPCRDGFHDGCLDFATCRCAVESGHTEAPL